MDPSIIYQADLVDDCDDPFQVFGEAAGVSIVDNRDSVGEAESQDVANLFFQPEGALELADHLTRAAVTCLRARNATATHAQEEHAPGF